MKNLTILTGASRGIGLAMAHQLLDKDAMLLCISRRFNDELAKTAAQKGAMLLHWELDLADGAAVAQRIGNWLGKLQARDLYSATLINNAGVIPALVPLGESDFNDLANALRVGLEAPMQLCAAFLGATRNWTIPRKVLNISSGLGRRPMASQSAYCAAKAGMDHFTRCMALDEAQKPNGAKVCSLAPGVVATDMQVQLRSAATAGFPDREWFEKLHSSGTLLSPEEAAQKVLSYLQKPDFGSDPIGDARL